MQPRIEQAKIVDTEFITSSDHNIVCAVVSIKHLVKSYSMAKMKKKNLSRTIYMYDEATKKNWKDYQADLKSYLLKNKKLKVFEKIVIVLI